ncbi:YheC/YheD family protein [Ammoniphilus sp. YIM 78166]|uniref:YheC/YheD family protein n=1 Tax=Ammoniphilus sp. YIM 78166 TaxID=1644106 RepID=UPI00107003E5|nr:YheC/YheD family protein [Ammoniphilus sp. YIM 78166]
MKEVNNPEDAYRQQMISRWRKIGYPILEIDNDTLQKMDSKLYMARILLKHPGVNKFIPETEYLTKRSLWKLVDKYKDVILKPISAYGGKGIMRLSLQEKRYEVHIKEKKKLFDQLEAVESYIFHKIGSTPYIVQQRVKLALIDKRPFDIRILVQKRSPKEWLTTGKLARVAGENRIVTNTSSGGTRLNLQDAVFSCQLKTNHPKYRAKLLKTLDEASIKIAQYLDRYFPFHNIYGMDLGIDEKGRILITEVNPWPSFRGYKHFDPPMYKIIRSIFYNNHLT